VLKAGEVIEYNGLRFEVDRVERRRVVSVRLELPAESETAEARTAAEGARAAG
jgi:CBS domain containing-hemolysin-like protein